MLRQHSRLVETGLRVIDLVSLVAALPAAHYLRLGLLESRTWAPSIDQYWPLLATVLLIWMAVAWMFDLYDRYRTQPFRKELFRLAKSMGVAGVAAGASGFLWQDASIPRGLLGLYLGIAFLALVVFRLVVRRLAHAARRRGYNSRRVAVVGSGDVAEEVLRTTCQ